MSVQAHEGFYDEREHKGLEGKPTQKEAKEKVTQQTGTILTYVNIHMVFLQEQQTGEAECKCMTSV